MKQYAWKHQGHKNFQIKIMHNSDTEKVENF